jgi:hypothetical protein
MHIIVPMICTLYYVPNQSLVVSHGIRRHSHVSVVAPYALMSDVDDTPHATVTILVSLSFALGHHKYCMMVLCVWWRCLMEVL